MYISYYTLNYSQFSTKNFDFFGTPSYWYFLISSSQWKFLTRCKKPHAISINTERVRSPRVQTFWWHLFNRDSQPGELHPYMAVSKPMSGEALRQSNTHLIRWVKTDVKNLQCEWYVWLSFKNYTQYNAKL